MGKDTRPIIISALTAGIIVAVSIGFYVWTVKTIPYSYRQSLLDGVDYAAGKNLFNRANSLQ